MGEEENPYNLRYFELVEREIKMQRPIDLDSNTYQAGFLKCSEETNPPFPKTYFLNVTEYMDPLNHICRGNNYLNYVITILLLIVIIIAVIIFQKKIRPHPRKQEGNYHQGINLENNQKKTTSTFLSKICCQDPVLHNDIERLV